MSQYQPKPNAYYRVQNIAYGYYLSLTDVREGVAPRLLNHQDTRQQYWKFVVDPSAKNTYKIVNAHPNPNDVDTHYALNVTPMSHTLVTKDADAKPSVWRINISEDRDHCSIITSYRDLPDSRPHLQGNANGAVNLADDDHKNNQRWRLIEVGAAHEQKPTPKPVQPHTPEPVPKRIDEIGDGNYTLINILNQYTPLFTAQGIPGVTRDHQMKPPLIFRYQNSASPYFTMKIYGTNMYVHESGGYLKGVVTSSPTLWYLVKAPGNTGYYICPKGPGKMRAWNAQTIDKHGVGPVLDNVAELLRGAKEGKLDADAWQRWWIWPSSYPNPGRVQH